MNITTTTTDKLDIPKGATVHYMANDLFAVCGAFFLHGSNYPPDVTCPDCLEAIGGNEPSSLTTLFNEGDELTSEDVEAIEHMLHLAQIRREKIAVLKYERDSYKDAYENMRQFAEENGLDTTTTGETERKDELVD